MRHVKILDFASKIRDYLLSLIVKLEKMKKVLEAVQVWSFCKELKLSEKLSRFLTVSTRGASCDYANPIPLKQWDLGKLSLDSLVTTSAVNAEWHLGAWLNVRACCAILSVDLRYLCEKFTSTFALFSNLVSRSVNFNVKSIESSSQVLHASRRFRVNWGKFEYIETCSSTREFAKVRKVNKFE